MSIKNKLPPICNYLLLCMVLCFYSCTAKNKKYTSPPYYNLNKPYVITLPSDINEISGMAYYGKDNSLFVESDAKGDIYKIPLKNPAAITRWKFSHSKDYEDIVLLDSTFYVLNSDGEIVVLNFINNSPVAKSYEFPDDKSNEFESLYYDSRIQKLRLVCKDCKSDNKQSNQTYIFDPVTFTYTSSFVIDTKKILGEEDDKGSRFKPSAASINPATQELYILSSINKVLVIATPDGVVKEVYPLNPKIYNHPEGITFTQQGDLFISNEAEKSIPATILYFKFQKQGR